MTPQDARKTNDRAAAMPARRRAARFPLMARPAKLALERATLTPILVQARAIEISALGARLLADSFVHAARPALVSIEDLHGEQVDLEAITRWCDYELQRGHHIGLSFSEPVDAHRFVPASTIDDIIRAETELSRETGGRAVIAIGQVGLRESATSELLSLGFTVETADSSGGAVDAYLAGPVDVLVTDRTLGTAGEGGALAAAWRARGFDGALVLVGDVDDLELSRVATQLGASEVIRRPWRPGRFGDAIADALDGYPFRSVNTPIFSTVEAIFGTPEAVRPVIARIREAADLLRVAQQADDRDTFVDAVRTIAHRAVDAGFPALAALADDLEATSRGSPASLAAAFDGSRRLGHLADRLALRADIAPDAATEAA